METLEATRIISKETKIVLQFLEFIVNCDFMNILQTYSYV